MPSTTPIAPPWRVIDDCEHYRRTRLGVSITRAEPSVAAAVQRAIDAGAEIVELRVDCIDDVDGIVRVLEARPAVPIIVTIRASDEGGHWDGSDAERVALFERLGLLLPGYVDVERATWRRSANLRQKIGLVCGDAADSEARPRNRLILSTHDLRETPPDVAAAARPVLASSCDVAKVVFAARDARDALRVLGLLRDTGDRRVIALATGAAGLVTRVLAPKFGGFLAFAALERGAEAAPGQPTVHELRDVYRWDAVSPSTAVYGVMGWPVAHSLSPLVHNAAMAARGIDGVYIPLPVEPTQEACSAFLDTVTRDAWLGFAGLSVTLPHKEHVLAWCERNGVELDDWARRCGAVNTLARGTGGAWHGSNTDAPGVLSALAHGGIRREDLRGARVHVLGAGGAARAAIVAVQACDSTVILSNRTLERATRLAEELGCAAAEWNVRGDVQADVVINCTSVGMWPDVDATPLRGADLKPGCVVLDTVYRPVETRLLLETRERGCVAVSGMEMFLAQAALQFVAWHGVDTPLEVMRARVGEV